MRKIVEQITGKVQEGKADLVFRKEVSKTVHVETFEDFEGGIQVEVTVTVDNYVDEDTFFETYPNAQSSIAQLREDVKTYLASRPAPWATHDDEAIESVVKSVTAYAGWHTV